MQNIARLMDGYGVSSIDELIKTVDKGGADPKKRRRRHVFAISRRGKCGGLGRFNEKAQIFHEKCNLRGNIVFPEN